LGKGANVYLSSAELAAVAAMLGRLPTVEEYMGKAAAVNAKAENIYRYLNFNLMEKYREEARKVIPIATA
jgi:aconitate hydratase 2/2-methylisocitrate dehydratase